MDRVFQLIFSLHSLSRSYITAIQTKSTPVSSDPKEPLNLTAQVTIIGFITMSLIMIIMMFRSWDSAPCSGCSSASATPAPTPRPGASSSPSTVTTRPTGLASPLHFRVNAGPGPRLQVRDPGVRQ